MSNIHSIDCITPLAVVSDNWGSAGQGQILNLERAYGYACIAPDSEADSVELRLVNPLRDEDWKDRITISRDAPYIGPISGKGIGIFPTMQIPVIGSGYEHRMKLLLYPVPLPQPPGPGVARIDFVVGLTGTAVMPLIPAMGRRHVKFDIQWTREAGDTSNIDIVIAGIQSNSAKYGIQSLYPGSWGTYPERFSAPANTDSFTGDGSDSSAWTETLYTEAAVVASTKISMVGTDAFDWYKITVTLNSGAFHGDSNFQVKCTLRE